MSKSFRKTYPKGYVIATKTRKKINWTKTLENYETRLSICRREFFVDLHQAYVSDYNLHRNLNHPSHIPILMKIAASHEGISILGTVSANQKNGEYVYLPQGIPQTAKIVYVGKSNFITKRLESPYSIRSKDIVLEDYFTLRYKEPLAIPTIPAPST